MRKVVLYIAMTLDGCIAKDNDDIGFLSVVESNGEDYGYSDFASTVDTVIMGHRTYDKILTFGGEFPHSDKKCYVISRTKHGKDRNVEFYNGDLGQLIATIRKKDGKNIFIDGGAQIVDLIDRFIISVIPYFLGGGIALFKPGRPEQNLKLIRSVTFPSGLVQLWYDKK